ncbi:MAG: hypothetical protein IK008_01695, partial [Bacteroidales bacterium]|nr:hypothetical protein [Bacteroidales bacterium]
MKTFSYIVFSLTLLLAFCLWLPNSISFTILWLSTTFLGIPLLIADIVAFAYLVRHWKEKGSKGLLLLLVSIPMLAVIGFDAPWKSVSDKTMSKHYHQHENELRELVQYAESLSDSVSLAFPTDTIHSGVSNKQYDNVMKLLKKTRCERIKTFCWDGNTLVFFRYSGFASNGYMFLPDGTVKIHRWDPLGSDISGLYDIEQRIGTGHSL